MDFSERIQIFLFDCFEPTGVYIYEELAELVVERVGGELHRAGDDDLGGDGVEHVPVLRAAR